MTLEAHVCGECGIEWAAPATWWAARRSNKKTFYCPNGHGRAFCESEADKLRRERDRLKQQLAEKDDSISWQRERREAAERQARAFKGVATRMKNRVSHGVCPCCNRTFQDLQRHMASKHKGFAASEITIPEGAAVQ